MFYLLVSAISRRSSSSDCHNQFPQVTSVHFMPNAVLFYLLCYGIVKIVMNAKGKTEKKEHNIRYAGKQGHVQQFPFQ